jgi:DNA-directed RNA polymerase subunit RPC12/RpoP
MAEAEGDESGSNTSWKLGSSPSQPRRLHEPQPQPIRCPECGSTRLNKDGMRYLKHGTSVQRYLCKDCGYRFSWPRSGKQQKRQNLKSGHALALDECSSRALALLEQRRGRGHEQLKRKMEAGLREPQRQTSQAKPEQRTSRAKWLNTFGGWKSRATLKQQ